MPLTPFAGFADAVPAELAGRAAVVVVVGLAVRVAGLVTVSGRWLYPGLTPQLRLGLVAVVAVATMPAAVVAAAISPRAAESSAYAAYAWRVTRGCMHQRDGGGKFRL